MTQTRSAVARLTKNMMVIDLMKTMGWPRDRALAVIEELEADSLVAFPNQGGMKLRMNVEAY